MRVRKKTTGKHNNGFQRIAMLPLKPSVILAK